MVRLRASYWEFLSSKYYRRVPYNWLTIYRQSLVKHQPVKSVMLQFIVITLILQINWYSVNESLPIHLGPLELRLACQRHENRLYIQIDNYKNVKFFSITCVIWKYQKINKKNTLLLRWHYKFSKFVFLSWDTVILIKTNCKHILRAFKNNVTQIWTIFTPSPSVTHSCLNPSPIPLPPLCVMSFMNDPL